MVYDLVNFTVLTGNVKFGFRLQTPIKLRFRPLVFWLDISIENLKLGSASSAHLLVKIHQTIHSKFEFSIYCMCFCHFNIKKPSIFTSCLSLNVLGSLFWTHPSPWRISTPGSGEHLGACLRTCIAQWVEPLLLNEGTFWLNISNGDLESWSATSPPPVSEVQEAKHSNSVCNFMCMYFQCQKTPHFLFFSVSLPNIRA